ncbi:LacI family DNA-binding transcriptional regulator [Schumannella luteola]
MTNNDVRRRVTAADIARSLGLSRATVGFVLNDTPGQTISPATRRRVLDEAARLGYRPHLGARALASGQSRVILLVLPDWPMDYSMREHIDEASTALDEAGYSLVTMTPHPSGRARPLWETLQPDLVMGMVPFSADQARTIMDAGCRVVSPDLAAELGTDLEHAVGPRVQIEHLAERGHRSVAFASTADPRLAALAGERESLARATAESLGLDFTSRAVDETTAADAVTGWLAGGVTAVAGYNDDIASLVLGAALRGGTPVPGQLAIIGHDDTPLARRLVPSLSSIHVDAAGLGHYFAELALHSVEGRDAPVAPPTTRATLVARESS